MCFYLGLLFTFYLFSYVGLWRSAEGLRAAFICMRQRQRISAAIWINLEGVTVRHVYCYFSVWKDYWSKLARFVGGNKDDVLP